MTRNISGAGNPLTRTRVLLLMACVMAGTSPARAQTGAVPGPVIDLAGQWAALRHEDAPYRGPGGFLGDYTGLPINAASRQMAQSWDAASHSQMERSTQAHPAQYAMRGEGPNIRINEVRHPITEQLLALTVTGVYGRADRTIWLDGRAHPSVNAEHTWDGFSTGTFHNGELTVTTTHMKMGVLQKVGVYASPYSVMTEHFFRHGLYLTMVSIIEDPIYLEEPFLRSQTWALDTTQDVVAAVPWESVEELVGKPVGWVPHYPLGTTHREPAEKYGIPFEATLGGAETLYPEYQLTIARLRAEAEAKAAAAASAAPRAGRARP